MKGKYFGLLVMLLLTFVTFLAPTTAKALGPVTGTGTDGFGNVWTVISTVTEGACEDHRGNAVPGRLYTYDVSVKDSSGNTLDPLPSVSQANVSHGICPDQYNITYPTDRSVKDLTCDPSSKWLCLVDDRGLFAWSSLKSDPDNHYRFSICLEGGGTKQEDMLLETAYGFVIVTPVLSLRCCTDTINASQINNVVGTNTLTTNYDACTSEIVSVAYNGDTKDPLPGLAYCQENSRGVLTKQNCYKIRKFSAGDVIFTRDPNCTFSSTTTTCPGYAHFGQGTKIYQFPATVTNPDTAVCTTPSQLGTVPHPGTMVVDDNFEFEFDGCGNGNVYLQDGTQVAGIDQNGDPIINPPIWLAPYDDAGNLLLNKATIFVSGSADGWVFYANPPCVGVGGFGYCRY